MPEDNPIALKATVAQTCVVGIVLLLCGAAMVYFFWNYYLDDIIPAPWLGYASIAAGLGFILLPHKFQERAGRLGQ